MTELPTWRNYPGLPYNIYGNAQQPRVLYMECRWKKDVAATVQRRVLDWAVNEMLYMEYRWKKDVYCHCAKKDSWLKGKWGALYGMQMEKGRTATVQRRILDWKVNAYCKVTNECACNFRLLSNRFIDAVCLASQSCEYLQFVPCWQKKKHDISWRMRLRRNWARCWW